jgi:hypothetical protein
MKSSLPLLVAVILSTTPAVFGSTHLHTASLQKKSSLHGNLLTRSEWHALNSAASQIRHFMRRVQPIGTRVWPHAVRDASGRAGLIIMAEKPCLMTLDTRDLHARQIWVLSSVIAAAQLAEKSALPLDHLALTDAHGVEGQLWYYDLDIRLALQLHRQLMERSISPEDAYSQVVCSWKLVTSPVEIASTK